MIVVCIICMHYHGDFCNSKIEFLLSTMRPSPITTKYHIPFRPSYPPPPPPPTCSNIGSPLIQYWKFYPHSTILYLVTLNPHYTTTSKETAVFSRSLTSMVYSSLVNSKSSGRSLNSVPKSHSMSKVLKKPSELVSECVS